MFNIRSAKLSDIPIIQKIEKEYYEGFNCPEETLKNWIKELSKNFLVAESNNQIVAFIFFEYLNEVKAIPFVHELAHDKNNKFVYISEVGVSVKFQDTNVLQKLFDSLIKISKKDNCEKIIWLTGSKSKHDKIELKILLDNMFKKTNNVKQWECYPNYFVDDHYIYLKQL